MIREKQSFTLVEILVVIVIIGILSSFIFFTINDSVDKASIAKSKMFSESIRNNLLLNLVSEWKLDGDATDSWGSNNGTMNNFPASPWKTEAECISGTCLEFDGVDDYIDCGDSVSFDFGIGDFSLSAWIKTNTTGYIINKRRAVDTSAIYMIVSENNIKGAIGDGVSFIKSTADGYSIVDNNWHYCVVVFDRSGNMTRYVDSEIYGTVSDISTVGNLQTGYNLSMGCMLTQGYYYDGVIDEVQIYNAAISESEIKQNYLSGLNNLYAKGLISDIEYNERINEIAKK
jgi:prepilin-type N-terminal cleavage/methylation domain-containing protein